VKVVKDLYIESNYSFDKYKDSKKDLFEEFGYSNSDELTAAFLNGQDFIQKQQQQITK